MRYGLRDSDSCSEVKLGRLCLPLGRLLSLAIVVGWLSYLIVTPSLGLAASSGQAGPVGTDTFSGWLTVLWGDAEGGGESPRRSYSLQSEQGSRIELQLNADLVRSAGGILNLDRRFVNVRGDLLSALGGADRVLEVRSIGLERQAGRNNATDGEDTGADSIAGPQPWVAVLCKFADDPGEPRSASYFEALIGGDRPGLDHYWRQLSYGAVNLTGSEAAGWYTLPRPRSYYTGLSTNNMLATLFDDCTAAADDDIDFSGFVGINLMFNNELDGFAWGGSHWASLDGQSGLWYTTWEPPWGYQNQVALAHEMGHGFGLPHSSGEYGRTYDNQWDVMSDTWSNCARSSDPSFGCLAQHTIAFHKDYLGWIPTNMRFVAGQGSHTIQLEQLSEPQNAEDLIALVPLGGSETHFYSVEVRRWPGYDIKLPGQAVVIHDVDTQRATSIARIVDIDGNGNTGDAGAMWTPGETFNDAANGIRVSIGSATLSGFIVTIESGPPVVDTGDSQGVFNPHAGRFMLRNSLSNGIPDYVIRYGARDKGWIPLTGDWNGDGVGTIGIYNPDMGRFLLRDSLTSGPPNHLFRFGPTDPGIVPLAGDWDGDGLDTAGVYDPSKGLFTLTNSLDPSGGDVRTFFGPRDQGWLPLVGDWDGDGIDGIGVYDPASGQFRLRNTATTGSPDLVFYFGPAGQGWIPLVGDWNGDGSAGVGVFQPESAQFRLRNSLSSGEPDTTYRYGAIDQDWMPVANNWDRH
jgi:M6 family metalloprotease-like protein